VIGSPGRWAIVVVLAFVAGALAAGLLLTGPVATGQTAASPRGGGVVVVPGQITKDSFGVYLVDLGSGTICMYQYVGRERSLRLLAARTFIYDVQLDSYNTTPLPKDIQKMVAEARRLKSTKPSP